MSDAPQAYIAKQNLAKELTKQASMAQAWFRTPVTLGGGGYGKDAYGEPIKVEEKDLATYIVGAVTHTSNVYKNSHGVYTLTTRDTGNDGWEVTIDAVSQAVSGIAAKVTFRLSETSMMKLLVVSGCEL